MRLPIAPLATFLLVVGCASARVNPNSGEMSPTRPVASFFPLAVGNSWTYETRFGDRVETNAVSIVSAVGDVFTDSRGNHFTIDAQGLRDERRYLLKAPLSKGTTWKSIPTVGKTERYEIVSTAAIVTVPAGKFENVVLVRGWTRLDPGTEIEVEWAYAPDVGLVRIASATLVGRQRATQGTTELVRYEIR